MCVYEDDEGKGSQGMVVVSVTSRVTETRALFHAFGYTLHPTIAYFIRTRAPARVCDSALNMFR